MKNWQGVVLKGDFTKLTQMKQKIFYLFSIFYLNKIKAIVSPLLSFLLKGLLKP